jgi:hypothetical protein
VVAGGLLVWWLLLDIDRRTMNHLASRPGYVMVSTEGFEPRSGVRTIIWFARDGFTLFAGCNYVDYEYKLRRNHRIEARSVGSTLLACPDDPDDWLRGFMVRAPRLELDGKRLAITGEDAKLVFIDGDSAPSRE